MPTYLINYEILKVLWPILVVSVLIALIITFLVGKSNDRKEIFFVVISFSMLGMVIGYLSGVSRTPTLNNVLPAVLSLIGGLIVYLVGKDSSNRIIICIALFALAFTLVIGSEWGATTREVADEFKHSTQYLERQAFIEREVNIFRKNLGLPPLPPKIETTQH
jgi:peptidoglycan/LPS O-acetylase OafA/YrhL